MAEANLETRLLKATSLSENQLRTLLESPVEGAASLNQYLGLLKDTDMDDVLYQFCRHLGFEYLKDIPVNDIAMDMIRNIPINYAKFASDLNAYSVHADKTFINKAFADDAKKRGLKIYAYTVDREQDITLMLKYGIDGIFTNYPVQTKAYLLSLQKDQLTSA